jgi:anti-anti-sigma factor
MSQLPSNPMTVETAIGLDDEAVCVRITGDVDLPGRALLDRTARHLATMACRTAYFDLSGVTFAGSVLVNFLYALSTRSSLVLCEPIPIVRRVIESTGLAQVARIDEHLPGEWATAPVQSAARTLPTPVAEAA